ncbi:MAG: hypothetical protein VYB54_13050 [Pseudomonadota bacterium]|nr:hypothetical protein [Pseudomonadota bacterium]
MSRVAIILLLLTPLGACGSDLFSGGPVDTDVKYAREVCEGAGPSSLACEDARRQVVLRCYNTIGVVDCYENDDPYGVGTTGRRIVRTVDGRPPPSAPAAE